MTVGGLAPFTFQWYTTNASGAFVPMTDGGNIFRLDQSTVTISNVALTRLEEYELVISEFLRRQ